MAAFEASSLERCAAPFRLVGRVRQGGGPDLSEVGGEAVMQVWCGVDWAERHHDVALVDDSGQVLIRARIDDDAAGFRRLLKLPVEVGTAPRPSAPMLICSSSAAPPTPSA